MRVLLVNQYFPPDTSATAEIFADLARVFVARGHRLTVLAGRPSYAPTQRPRWSLLQRAETDGIAIERVGSTGFDRSNMLGRTTNYVSYLTLATARGLLLRRPDVVIAGSDPPLAVLAALAAARGRPVIYSLRDLHPATALTTGMVEPGRITELWDRAHRWAMQQCELIVCLGDAMAERVQAMGVAPERTRVVYDGAPLPTTPPDRRIVDELRAGERFVAVHAGNLGSAGPWETLAAAAARVGWTSMLFVGDGTRAEFLRSRGLRVVPFLPVHHIPAVMAAGDVQIVALRRGLEGLVVPSKFFTALAHGRPVLAVVPEASEVARIVRQWCCGLVADPDDPDAVVACLERMRSEPDLLAAMAERARAAGAAFERGRMAVEFVEIVEAAAGRAR